VCIEVVPGNSQFRHAKEASVVKNNWLAVILMAALSTQAQSLHAVKVIVPHTVGFPAALSFYCSQAYDRTSCAADVVALRVRLTQYPMGRLGQWTFVLVPSDQWSALVRSLGGDPVSPAFTVLENRTTVLEQALFSGSAAREAELLKQFWTMHEGILELAITHELGHVICSETDERRADDYGRDLREGKNLTCQETKLKAKR
jgi:hypothetical protein